MRSDALLAFVPIGSPLSLVAGAGIAIPSTNTIDLLGQGTGQPPANIIGNAVTFGQDPGIGTLRPVIECGIGTTFAGAGNPTLNVALQYAADTGVAGGYQPGPWQTVAETGPLALSQLVAGAKVARFPWLPASPPNLRPRFVRMLFSPNTGGQFTAGTIDHALTVTGRDDQANRYAAKNYAVS